jgi:hypothetical protein
MDLILWRSMVVAAQRRNVHEPRAVGWQLGLVRLLRPARRVIRQAMALAGRSATRHMHR